MSAPTPTTEADWLPPDMPMPEEPQPETPEDEAEEYIDPWTPADLWPLLDEDYAPPVPTMLRREDGLALIYPSRLHTLQGESESGKTWVALEAMRQALAEERRVVYVDFEDCAETLVQRLLALGVPGSQIGHLVVYDAPSGWTTGADGVAENHSDAALIVIDGVNAGMASAGLNPIDVADCAKWVNRLRGWCRSGPAVVQIDHVVKSSENRGRYALGSVHKLNSVDGAAYTVEPVRPFGRGCEGLSRISVVKDRPGAIRGAIQGSRVAEARFTSDAETGAVTVTLAVPEVSATESGGLRPTVLMARVSDALEAHHGPMTMTAIEQAVSGRAEYVRRAVEVLIEEGCIESVTAGRSRLHTLVKPFTDDARTGGAR